MAGKHSKIIFPLLCAALIAVFAATVLYTVFPAPYRDTVEKYGAKYGVEPALIYAVIKAESNFDPDAVSHAGAKGLAQLTDDTARYVAQLLGEEYSDGDSFDAETNIRRAAFYLKYLLIKYGGDLVCTIAAYNAGEGNVDKWLASEDVMSSIPFRETDRYLKKVIIYHKIYGIIYKY